MAMGVTRESLDDLKYDASSPRSEQLKDRITTAILTALQHYANDGTDDVTIMIRERERIG